MGILAKLDRAGDPDGFAMRIIPQYCLLLTLGSKEKSKHAKHILATSAADFENARRPKRLPEAVFCFTSCACGIVYEASRIRTAVVPYFLAAGSGSRHLLFCCFV